MEAGSSRNTCLSELCIREGVKLRLTRRTFIIFPLNKQARLKLTLLLHASQEVSKAKNLSLFTLRYGREGVWWCVGSTGEELVPAGEAAFAVLRRDTGWSMQCCACINARET